MRISAEVGDYARSIAADCRVDSVCALLCDTTSGAVQVHVLGNFGVEETVLNLYREHRICDRDPFHHDGFGADAARDRAGFRPVDHPTVQRCGERARDYWAFVSQQDVEVIGAAVVPLRPQIHLSIGVHRSRRRRYRTGAPVERLASRVETLGQRITIELLSAMLASGRGYRSLIEALRPDDAPLAPVLADLSAREVEITRLVCEGKQNKQIAWQANLSECTIENHLRRIYQKFGIHNRAALVAKMGELTW